jgi:probable rRNA maturation factor
MRIYLRNSQKSIKLNLPKIRRDLGRALLRLGCESAELSVLFVDDRSMSALNARYRGAEGPTDVLSFPMYEECHSSTASLLGDIVICVPRALAQSAEYGVPFYSELLRLLVHGLLHLIGYDHEKGAYQKRKMKNKERELLNALQAVA